MTADEKIPIRLAAITHSKHRNVIGLVGIEIDQPEDKIYVKLARQWNRTRLYTIPQEISRLYHTINWGETFIDQQTGQHLIQEMQRIRDMPLSIITTQRNLKDPENIEKTKVMDKIEMTQYMLSLRQNHKIEFPERPSSEMRELESQMPLFSEHKTESGSMDYYSPGDELDDLPKALLIACFAARKYMRLGIIEPVAYSANPKVSLQYNNDNYDLIDELYDDPHVTVNDVAVSYPGMGDGYGEF